MQGLAGHNYNDHRVEMLHFADEAREFRIMCGKFHALLLVFILGALSSLCTQTLGEDELEFSRALR